MVAAGAGEDLRRLGMPTWEAWAEAARLMDAHGRAPTMDAVKAAMAAARGGRRSADPEAKRRSAGALHCVLRALGRWPDHEGLLWMAPMMVRDYIIDLSTDPREEEALARALADAVSRLTAHGSYGEFTAADARTMHAVALLQLPEADARETGRELIAEQVEVMERLLAGELVFAGKSAPAKLVESAWRLHAMAVNNLAQAWEQRVEGVPADNLRAAIAAYERCCALPARVAEPEKLLHSLHHLALCLRKLAHEVDDNAERGALLERARDVAERGLELPRKHPEASFPMLDALRLNRANTEGHLLLLQKETGVLAPEEADRRLREHVEGTLAWLRTTPLRDRAEGRAAEAFFAQFLGGADHQEAAAAALQALVGRLAQDGPQHIRFMTRDEAELALSAMVALTPDGEPSPRALRPEVHGCLPIVLGALHPLHTGVAAARELYELELAWMRPQLRPLSWIGRKYIEDAISGMHRWMCDADLPDAHRRLFAAQIGQLASLALDPEVGLVGLDILDRVRFHDLMGAAFYRAESTFYGQGPSHEAPPVTEAGWRISLYRARQMLDHCALLHTYEELRPLIDRVQPGALDEILATMRMYMVCSDDGRELRDTLSPLAEMSELRAEILEYRRVGQPRGWRPAFVETTPAPQRDEIAGWLGERPTTGLLLAGDAELGLVHGARELTYLRFDEYCSDSWSRMLALADELALAWARLLQGPSEQLDHALRDLDAALLQVTLDHGWRALAERLAEMVTSHGLRCLTVVERGGWRAFPWGSLPVKAGVLADVVAIVHVPSLATTGAHEAPLRSGVLAYVGAAEGKAPELEFGRAVFRSAGDVVAGLRREAFEPLCVGAGVVRMFTHGDFNSSDAMVSGIVLDAADEQEPPYQGYEIAAMDLGGCGRVELWACESGVQMDFLGELLGNDEPLGLASCFLLAGARVVVGSLWKQPAMVAGLIAAAFSAVVGLPGSAEGDALALALALADYRRAVDEGGPFEAAFCRSLAASLRAPVPVAGAITRAIRAAWCETAAHLAGRGPIEVPLSTIPEQDDAGLDELRELIDEPDELDLELRRCARRILGSLRGPAAWAGWRVLARDRSVI